MVFFALFGYVNGAETEKARARLAVANHSTDNVTLLHEVAGSAAGRMGRVAAALHRRRIRLNLVSGIEFEMAVLIVAPLIAAATGGYAPAVGHRGRRGATGGLRGGAHPPVLVGHPGGVPL